MSQEIEVFGHHQSLKLIKISEEDREAIKGDGLYISGQSSYLWPGDVEGTVLEGFFANLTVKAGDETYSIDIPDDVAPIEVREQTFLVATSDNKMWLKGEADNFDPDQLEVSVQCFDFDEDSETYTFANISYPAAQFEEDDRQPVHDGFILIDADDGILELIAEDDGDGDGFTLRLAD